MSTVCLPNLIDICAFSCYFWPVLQINMYLSFSELAVTVKDR